MMEKWHLNVETLEPRSLLSAGLTGGGPSPQVAAIPVTAGANAVVTWNAVALEAIRVDKTAPPATARDLVIVQTSVYDAVNSVLPTGLYYRVRLKAPFGASADAAAVGAAYESLHALFPKQSALFDASLSLSLDGLPDTQGTADGLKLGERGSLTRNSPCGPTTGRR